MDDRAFEMVIKKIDDLEKKVDELLRFKYTVAGVAGFFSFVVSAFVSYLVSK